MPSRVYLDHNATSPLLDHARDAANAALRLGPLNAGSVHAEGQRARALLERARATVTASLGPQPGRLVFCSGATEANNVALLGAPNAKVVVLSALEHPSIRAAADIFAKRGAEVRWWPHDQTGRVDLTAARALLDGAELCALMAANNELGNRNDIVALAALCAELGVELHVDAAQVAGRWRFEVPAGVSTVTLSAHKSGGPAGVGALWLADGVVRAPLVVGGHQERGLRAGTEDVAAAVAMAAIYQTLEPRWAALEPVRDALEVVLEQAGASVNGDRAQRIPNTLNFSWPGLEAEAALMALDLAGYALSAGSACTAGSVDLSPVLAALGLEDWRARSALRISLGPEHQDIDGAALGWAIVAVLRKASRSRSSGVDASKLAFGRPLAAAAAFRKH